MERLLRSPVSFADNVLIWSLNSLRLAMHVIGAFER